jgi:hypothetical protein
MSYPKNRRGAALLIVLIIVMAVTILSLGFLSRSTVELECGKNMLLHTQMNYLAESAMEYAKQRIISPQGCSGEYWGGGAALQIDNTSNNYFDVSVVKNDNCNYTIETEAYRFASGVRTGFSRLRANLRLNPCIAYWQGGSYAIPLYGVINGDVYSSGKLTNYASINGDAYSGGAILDTWHGYITGRRYEGAASTLFELPSLVVSAFKTQYYIGSNSYSVEQITAGTYTSLVRAPTTANPAGVIYCDGDLTLNGATITGMLVVKGALKLKGSSQKITAVKNFPALLVGGDLSYENSSVKLTVTGLAQIGGNIDCKNKIGSEFNLNGALYILGGGFTNTYYGLITISALPNKAAIEIWQNPVTVKKWSPASGAIFQSIKRN